MSTLNTIPQHKISYIVTIGYHEDYEILGVYDTKEKAEKVQLNYNSANEGEEAVIEEWQTNRFIKEIDNGTELCNIAISILNGGILNLTKYPITHFRALNYFYDSINDILHTTALATSQKKAINIARLYILKYQKGEKK